MKKTIVLGILFILLGSFCGKYLYKSFFSDDSGVFNENNKYYFLQEGVYLSKEIMNENIKDINNKAIIQENDKYYVYLGITKNYDIAQKIKKIYEDLGYQIYIKEMNISSEEFVNNLEQFDLLIKNSNSDEDILTIEEVVLANYEEIVQNYN